jgi:hypothetical protein
MKTGGAKPGHTGHGRCSHNEDTADETGWRNDGHNGYAWLFCTPDMNIFSFKDTRSASVPKGVFGEERPPGVLVAGRYNGYNKLPVKITVLLCSSFTGCGKAGKGLP